MDTKTIKPRQQIKNVTNCLRRAQAAKPYRGRAWTIRACQRQLAEMWVKYRRGELASITDELPF